MDFALINALPFLMAALLALPVTGKQLPAIVRTWGTTLMMAVLFIALLGYFPLVQDAHHEKEALIRVIEWVPELGLAFSFYLDGLSLMFSLIVTGIGAGIALYAGYYFDDEEEQRRFLWLFLAFAGAMLGLVLSGNLITIFIMWELTSVTSFMLIGFKGAKSENARFGATQAFLITSAGALALLLGIVMLGAATSAILAHPGGFTFELKEILKLDLTVHRHYGAFAILIIIGAFTKSAQFPFHFWLPGAMEAPTPASAYLHSATMVKAGIYLLARLYPSLGDSNLWLVALTGFGVFTMFMGAFFALTRDDMKAVLAYSTVSKLGAIVALLGLPDGLGIKAAFIGIMAHALYKAALFLSAGTIDHSTGTRLLSKLGGLRHQMPGIMIVVSVSALSMAGVPVFFGFVSKETLLDAFYHGEFGGSLLAFWIVVLASVLTVAVGAILIWDLFFKKPDHEIHFHASSPFLTLVPGVLAVGSASLGVLLVPVIEPLINTMLTKEVHLHLFPEEGLANQVFQLSLVVLASGFILFLTRSAWLRYVKLPIPRGEDIFRWTQNAFNRAGDVSLRLQGGYVRYYLIIIFGAVSIVLLSSGLLADLARGQSVAELQLELSGEALLQAILLMMIVAAASMTVLFKKHIYAVLALGVLGYAVGGLFLLEPAPDVALVQFLVETLATVLIILILSRISETQREDVIDRLWKGRTVITFYDKSGELTPNHVSSQFKHFGLFRDGFIAVTVGITVFLFSVTALLNRAERSSIAEYYLQNAYTDVHVTDVVGAIVSDYRGMDTIIEIAVFITASLGVLTLLSRGRQQQNPLIPTDAYTYDEKAEDVREVTSLETPFTRMVARLVLPLTFMIALSHLLLGGGAPGDGFTAGAITGLVTALWFVVFGYTNTKKELGIVAPYRLMRTGVLIVIFNALLPVILGIGDFAGTQDYGKALGIAETLSTFGLHFTSTFIFEVGVAIAVFGGTSAIMETIAYPEKPELTEDL